MKPTQKKQHQSLEGSATSDSAVLRVATYNIHKGVRGIGFRKRLEIHNLALAVEALDADFIFLQEVRAFHHRQALQFAQHQQGWPPLPQADYLAPEGYHCVYRSNAVTTHGEHGNALLSRWPVGAVSHRDVSDHRFEQRGLLHVQTHWHGITVHAIVAHLGLIHASRMRQAQHISAFIAERIPSTDCIVLAGDFNDWRARLDGPMQAMGLARAQLTPKLAPRTFPSRLPLFSLDRIYTRGFECKSIVVPQGSAWAKLSDHLPLLVELAHR
jgi:endonuclease/exonuclease/phosphatase family metal-dependent hydrolase